MVIRDIEIILGGPTLEFAADYHRTIFIFRASLCAGARAVAINRICL